MMIYLIGGVARVGKSTLASIILNQNHISCLSTDVVRNFLDYSPVNLGLANLDDAERPRAFHPYLYKLLRILQNKYDDYVVEGDLITPSTVHSLESQVRLQCCFLGASVLQVEDLRKSPPHLDWVGRLTFEQQIALSESLERDSVRLSVEAQKYGYPYFDVHPDRKSAIESAYAALLTPEVTR